MSCADRLASALTIFAFGLALIPMAWGAAPPTGGGTPTEAPTPIEAASAVVPPGEVSDRAEAVLTELRAAENELSGDSGSSAASANGQTFARALAAATLDIDARDEETAGLVRSEPSLDALRSATNGWTKTREPIQSLRKDLGGRSAQIEKLIERTNELERIWTATRDASNATTTSTEVRARIDQTLAAIRQTRTTFERRHAEILAQIDRVARLDGRVAAALKSIESMRATAMERLFVRQVPALWHIDRATAEVAPSTDVMAFDAQWQELRAWAAREFEAIALHLAITLGVAVLLIFVRRRALAWAAKEEASAMSPGADAPHPTRTRPIPTPAEAVEVFATPFAAALLLSIWASRWFYPDAPRLAWVVLGAGALVATVKLLARVVDPPIARILYAVLLFYIVDQVRPLLVEHGLTERLVFVLEMLAGAFAALYTSRLVADQVHRRGRLARWTCRGAWLVATLFLLAAFADVLGYANLAELLARAVLSSAYTGIIIYSGVLILDALALMALNVRPLTLLHMVERNTERIWSWTRRALRTLAFLFWVWLVLDRLTVRERLIAEAHEAMGYGFKLSSIELTVGDVFAFLLAMAIALALSRLARFVFEEDVVPRVRLPVGIPYAISRTLHYVIVSIGAMVALAAIGVDMTKFTILIGALTVGIGFGLQNIINNFVSGLILLFERPVKVGDVIQMEDQTGLVERIGIRASVIRTSSGADVILPNGKFISDRLTNWTRSTTYRPIEIPITVAGGAPAREVMALIASAAAKQPGVTAHPAPEVLLNHVGGDALAFELRIWTDRAEAWMRVRSDVNLALNEALNAAGIAIK